MSELGLIGWRPDELTFEEEWHIYRFRGKVVPSVTQILDRLHHLANVPLEVLDTARTRGSYVHLATELYDQGTLDELTVDVEHVGYLEGWRKFLAEHRPIWKAIERRFYHPGFAYAGTPDRYGDIDYKAQRRFAQVDIKTSASPHPIWGMQTAAYDAAAGIKGGLRLTCQLRPNGTYKLIEWPDPTDWPAFLSLITIDNWTRKYLK